MITITASSATPPPAWAQLQRDVIATMNEAAVAFVERYTNPDGSLTWRDEWPGMDGSDDGYESFGTFPLFYALGGSPRVLDLAHRQWDAVTRQFTAYGQVYREFDAYYDWMHHGESNNYLYGFGLADPHSEVQRERAIRFAAMYMGEDAEADNWDPVHRMIRSPINGSRGPRFTMTAEDWSTHREVLAHYLSPWEDVPGTGADRDPLALADWEDDVVFEAVLERINARMARGDVPLNLTATSLITHAFLHTGEEKYRKWVLDYLGAWRERTEANGGITPDNVGPNGIIGECMDGKWWGGYYGWRWPHGSFSILEPLLTAGTNALLLTGDASHLELVRDQANRLLDLGKTEDGVFVTPNRHGDVGWFDYHPPHPRYHAHLHYLGGDDRDREHLVRYFDIEQWPEQGGFGKGGQYTPYPWHAYNEGRHADYPEVVMQHTLNEVQRRLEIMRNDNGDPAKWDVHHWQDINPVVTETLMQLTMGSPGMIYHGGLCHARIRYFDPVGKRAGLPQAVAARVGQVTQDSLALELVNLESNEKREVIVQAGAFAEHLFTRCETMGEAPEVLFEEHRGVGAFKVTMEPSSSIRLRLSTTLYARTPSYALPF